MVNKKKALGLIQILLNQFSYSGAYLLPNQALNLLFTNNTWNRKVVWREILNHPNCWSSPASRRSLYLRAGMRPRMFPSCQKSARRRDLDPPKQRGTERRPRCLQNLGTVAHLQKAELRYLSSSAPWPRNIRPLHKYKRCSLIHSVIYQYLLKMLGLLRWVTIPSEKHTVPPALRHLLWKTCDTKLYIRIRYSRHIDKSWSTYLEYYVNTISVRAIS